MKRIVKTVALGQDFIPVILSLLTAKILVRFQFSSYETYCEDGSIGTGFYPSNFVFPVSTFMSILRIYLCPTDAM